MLKKRVISNNIVTVLKAGGKHMVADVIATQNDVSHGVRWCNIVLTLKRLYKYM